jgi:hypothetical protein
MKLSSSFRSGFTAGLRSPFNIWRSIAGSTKIDTAPRHTDTVFRAWAETGRLLREAECNEVQNVEQTKAAQKIRHRNNVAA